MRLDRVIYLLSYIVIHRDEKNSRCECNLQDLKINFHMHCGFVLVKCLFVGMLILFSLFMDSI